MASPLPKFVLALAIIVLFSEKTECAGASVANDLGTESRYSEDSRQNYFFYQQSEYPRDCQEVLRECFSSSPSGVSFIKPDGYPDPFEVYCDHVEDSGGWTVIQRRVDGFVKFNRLWEDYKHGFGFPLNDFWLGNEKIAFMTNQAVYELQLDMDLSNGTTLHVSYSSFRIGDEWDNYQILQMGGFKASGAVVVNTNPTFQTGCPATLVIETAHGSETAVATFSTPVCNDTGDIGVITSVCSSADGLTSGSSFPIGTTTVTCTCTDSGSLTESCSFHVEVSESTCESGWLTYSGSRYCVFHDKLSWPAASLVCSGLGTHLAWVESAAESQFITDNIVGATLVGMSDAMNEGVWKYVDSDATSNYFNWGSGQPDNSHNEDCVEIYTNGLWNDHGCERYRHDFICESS